LQTERLVIDAVYNIYKVHSDPTQQLCYKNARKKLGFFTLLPKRPNPLQESQKSEPKHHLRKAKAVWVWSIKGVLVTNHRMQNITWSGKGA
jgi:hypothetical protein